MAIVLTNGIYYIATNRKGGIIKTPIIEDAQTFYSVSVDMTLDHIIPLSMGGKDDMENLQAACNQFKSNILPDDFMDRIIKIFLYQTENKCSKDMKLKIIHKLVQAL